MILYQMEDEMVFVQRCYNDKRILVFPAAILDDGITDNIDFFLKKVLVHIVM